MVESPTMTILIFLSSAGDGATNSPATTNATRGPAGSEIHTRAGMVQIPVASAIRVVDPTGCGDAYRAGLIYGLMKGMDLATTGRIASLMGALKIESLGPQNQRFTFDEFAEQFRMQFGYALS